MEERRRYERTITSIRVELHHPSFGTIVGFTRDISDGGAQVVIENAQLPPVGTLVHVLFKKDYRPREHRACGDAGYAYASQYAGVNVCPQWLSLARLIVATLMSRRYYD